MAWECGLNVSAKSRPWNGDCFTMRFYRLQQPYWTSSSKYGVVVLTNEQATSAGDALLLKIVDMILGQSIQDWDTVFDQAQAAERLGRAQQSQTTSSSLHHNLCLRHSQTSRSTQAHTATQHMEP